MGPSNKSMDSSVGVRGSRPRSKSASKLNSSPSASIWGSASCSDTSSVRLCRSSLSALPPSAPMASSPRLSSISPRDSSNVGDEDSSSGDRSSGEIFSGEISSGGASSKGPSSDENSSSGDRSSGRSPSKDRSSTSGRKGSPRAVPLPRPAETSSRSMAPSRLMGAIASSSKASSASKSGMSSG